MRRPTGPGRQHLTTYSSAGRRDSSGVEPSSEKSVRAAQRAPLHHLASTRLVLPSSPLLSNQHLPRLCRLPWLDTPTKTCMTVPLMPEIKVSGEIPGWK